MDEISRWGHELTILGIVPYYYIAEDERGNMWVCWHGFAGEFLERNEKFSKKKMLETARTDLFSPISRSLAKNFL